MPGEARRVKEVPGGAGSADQGIVIGRVLVETGLSLPPVLRRQETERRRLQPCQNPPAIRRRTPARSRDFGRHRRFPAADHLRRCGRPVLTRSRVNGTVGIGCITGPVKPICLRTGTTGSKTPAISPMRCDQAPAVQITVSVLTEPWFVRTAVTLLSWISIAVTSVCSQQTTPSVRVPRRHSRGRPVRAERSRPAARMTRREEPMGRSRG